MGLEYVAYTQSGLLVLPVAFLLAQVKSSGKIILDLLQNSSLPPWVEVSWRGHRLQ